MNTQETQGKLEELLARYPETKYFQIFPRLVLGWDTPNFISFALEIVKINPDPEAGEVYWQQRPKKAWGDRPADPGWVTLSKIGLDRLAVAMGVKWQGGRRMDNGSDPDRMLWEQRAAIIQLTGIDTFAESYELNLRVRRERDEITRRQDSSGYDSKKKVKLRSGDWRPWGSLTPIEQKEYLAFQTDLFILQIRDSMTQRVQTGAKNRVIRSIAGIPPKFRPATLGEKPFAVLKIVPSPKTEVERLAYIGHLAHAGALSAAYPPPTLGPGVPQARPLIQAPVEQDPSDLTEEIPIGDLAEAEIVSEAEIEPQEQETEKAAPELGGEGDRAPAGKSEAEKTVDGPFVNEIKDLYVELGQIVGSVEAKKVLYELAEAAGGTFTEQVDPEIQKKTIDALRAKIEAARGGSGLRDKDPQSSDSPSQDAGAPRFDNAILEIRYQALLRMESHEVEKSLGSESQDYPTHDPAGILKILNKRSTEKKGGDEDRNLLIEATIKIIEWKMKNYVR